MSINTLTSPFAVSLVALVWLVSVPTLHATTIVSLINRNGIVIISDSKTTVRDGSEVGPNMLCKGKEVKKVAIVKERLAIAASDSACFSYSDPKGKLIPVDFNFIPWIHDLEKTLPNDVSVMQLARIIQQEFSELTPKIRPFITNGQWGKPEDPLENFERLITFSIVGYDRGFPRLAVIKFYIDWSIKDTTLGYCNDLIFQPADFTNTYPAGITEAITDFRYRDNYAHKRAMAIDRKTFTDFFSNRVPTLNESITIAGVLVKIEEEIRPDAVGGPIRGVKITPDGRATEVTAYPLPKPGTEKGKKAHK